MKAQLLHRQDPPTVDPPPNADVLFEDLGLESLVVAMARGDRFLDEIARRTLLTSLAAAGDILYRQEVLRDALRHAGLVRDLYAHATTAVTSEERRTYVGFGRSAATALAGAVPIMDFLVEALQGWRALADRRPPDLRSEGLCSLFDVATRDLDDAYLARLREQLQALRLSGGVRFRARLGTGLKIADPVLLAPSPRRNWIQQLLPPALLGDALKIPPGDTAGTKLLDELRDRSLQDVARTLAESTEHVTAFFDDLRAQLAFYVGCLNLYDALTAYGQPVCFPELATADAPTFEARGLYDAGLCMRMRGSVVGNDVNADNKKLVMITGANQGGKSTFLRSVGISQTMTHAGMFVPAESLRLDPRTPLLTHFKTGEDPTMRRGKLDEELARMSDIADHLRPGAMVLLNESFSSTNDAEGSQIAAGIVRALMESGVKVFFVTHLLGVGDAIEEAQGQDTLFLRAERRPDGRRTYRLVEGNPLSTSHAEDLYNRIFGQS